MQITDNVNEDKPNLENLINNNSSSSINNKIETNSTSSNSKPKNYRIKNTEWQCIGCDIFCNSQTQYEVHLLSQKHKLCEKKKHMISIDEVCNALNSTQINNNESNELLDNTNSCSNQIIYDENNNIVEKEEDYTFDIHDYSLAEQFRIVAQNYLIPDDKKIGKFEKFGFYCSKCDAYMTGQIQLVMHVKGSKHQFFCPGEIPGYAPTKIFNPSYKSNKFSNFNRMSNNNKDQKYTNSTFLLNKNYSNMINKDHNQIINTKIQNRNSFMSSPIKSNQINGTYLDYLIKNQSLMNGQYVPQRYYANGVFNQHHHHQLGTPLYNQFNQIHVNNSSINDPAYVKAIQQQHSLYNNTTPSTPSMLNQNSGAGQNNGAFFGAYLNQTHPQVFNHNINNRSMSNTPNYQVNHPIRIIATPSTHNLIMFNNLNNENTHLNLNVNQADTNTNVKPNNLTNTSNNTISNGNTANCIPANNSDNCLNRSFENAYTTYTQMNNYETNNQLFNQVQAQTQAQQVQQQAQQPQLHHYSNGVAIISKQEILHQQVPQQQQQQQQQQLQNISQTQLYFQPQTARINANNAFIINQAESNVISSSQPTNIPSNVAYYQQQNYQPIN